MITGGGHELAGHPLAGLPYVDQIGPGGRTERRYLALLHAPQETAAMRAAPTWASTGLKPVPRDGWPRLAFERVYTQIPILNQMQNGACVAFTGTTAALLAYARSGAPYHALSPWFLYTLINDGVDHGSYADRCIQALTDYGICEDSYVPAGTIAPFGYSAAARANAEHYRLCSAIRLTIHAGDQTLSEVLTSLALGYTVFMDVQAGPGFDTGPDGTLAYLGSFTNHEIAAGEGIRFDSRGEPQIQIRNSWDDYWGEGGFAWATAAHLLASRQLWALTAMRAHRADLADVVPLA